MKKSAGFAIGLALAAAALVTCVLPVEAKDEMTVVTANTEIKWMDAAVPGVKTAVVSGDMAKGPSRFYLSYPPGLVTPLHSHSADHFVTTISGTVLLTIDGKEHRLGPGSYFALTKKKPHLAKVEGDVPAVMFIEAKSAWDVVPEKEKK